MSKKQSKKPVKPLSNYDTVKAWFKNSETIFLARAATFGGTVTAFVGVLDFSPIWAVLSTGTFFTKQQLIAIGISVLGAGITVEMARRRGMK